MTQNVARGRKGGRVGRAVLASAVLVALATGCSPSADGAGSSGSPAAESEATNIPGQVIVRAPDVDLSITNAVAHIGSSGTGTLTMTVHNGGDAPEHLDMVAVPDGGQGALAGVGRQGTAGSMSTAGILIPKNATVVFGGSGPTIRLPAVHGVTSADGTLPLALEFGIARLVHVTARVSAS